MFGHRHASYDRVGPRLAGSNWKRRRDRCRSTPGEAVGPVFDSTPTSAFAYCPVPKVPKRNAAPWLFPHIIARWKPGMIGVLRNGQRSCNEGNGYPDHVTAMLAATPGGDTPESWLICTRAFQRRYGLGASRPSSLPVWPYLRSAYLRKGRMIKFLRLVPGFDAKAFDPFLATGAELGAKNIVTAPCDPDLGQSTANLGAFTEGASGFGLFPVLEFFPGPTLLISSRSCRSG